MEWNGWNKGLFRQLARGLFYLVQTESADTSAKAGHFSLAGISGDEGTTLSRARCGSLTSLPDVWKSAIWAGKGV